MPTNTNIFSLTLLFPLCLSVCLLSLSPPLLSATIRSSDLQDSKSMVRSTTLLSDHLSHPRLLDSPKIFLFIPITLAFVTSLYILFYISSTSKLLSSHHHYHPFHLSLGGPKIILSNNSISSHPTTQSPLKTSSEVPNLLKSGKALPIGSPEARDSWSSRQSFGSPVSLPGKYVSNDVFHDKDIFLEDYKEMNRSFKIYVYPHRKDDPYAHVFLPVDFQPGGNYASESYFKKVLMRSHFITEDPSEADLFFMPFSIARLRHDSRMTVEGIPDFIKAYIFNISHSYPYWNRTGGTDHFYVACHSIGRSAMNKAEQVKFNAIQVVCSSSYFLSGYIAHKDASLPQIWPRSGNPPNLVSSKRKNLAFFAGASNSPVRQVLLKAWRNDSEISVHSSRLPTPYADALLGSKFCLHVKGFEVNTARIGDSIYYGCVPVIIANYYDLPFADILNWKSFSVVVTTSNIPVLKKILLGVSSEEYRTLQRNILKVRKHFQWNLSPLDYDVFYMVMYELWLRRSSIRFPINGLFDPDKRYGNISSCTV